MKKILSALLLASMLVAALASCATDDAAGTTTAGTTTPAATTTTKAPPPDVLPPDTDADDVPTPPQVPGAGLEELLDGKTKVEVDMTQLGIVDFDAWDDNNNNENFDKLFDGIKTKEQWYYNEDGTLKENANPDTTEGGGPGKCGGQASWGDDAGAWFYFALTEEAKVSAYVITTGNDNSKYTVRNPVEWTLYGTNDAEAFAAAIAGGLGNNPSEGEDTRVTLTDIPFAEDKWTVLDYVYDGQVAQGDFLENGYEIDADKQQSFKYYCWYLGYTGDGNFQACELELYK